MLYVKVDFLIPDKGINSVMVPADNPVARFEEITGEPAESIINISEKCKKYLLFVKEYHTRQVHFFYSLEEAESFAYRYADAQIFVEEEETKQHSRYGSVPYNLCNLIEEEHMPE